MSAKKARRLLARTAGVVQVAKARPEKSSGGENLAGKSKKALERRQQQAARTALQVLTNLLPQSGEASSGSPPKKKARASGDIATVVQRRGGNKAVVLRGSYNATNNTYDFNGELGAKYSICGLGAQIRDGTLRLSDLKKSNEEGQPLYGVPETTMRRWMKDDAVVVGRGGQPGTPHWLAERDTRQRKGLKKSGPPPVLGGAEKVIASYVLDHKKIGNPFPKIMVKKALLKSAIEIGATHNGRGYTETTNVDELYNGFLRRTKTNLNVDLMHTHAQTQSTQRARVSIEALQENVEKVRGPLRAFQEKYGAVSLERVGNFDETFLDLGKFANAANTYLVPNDGVETSVMVPFERAPHVTLLILILGAKLCRIIVVIKGADGRLPSPAHLGRLKDKSRIGLVQSETGWINGELKYGAMEQWIEDLGLGPDSEPVVMNFDGHHSNTERRQVGEGGEAKQSIMALMRQNKIFGHCPCAHSTDKGTQQADLKDGVVQRGCAAFDRLMAQHMLYQNKPERGVYQGRIPICDMVALVEEAFFEVTFDPMKNVRDHKAVGYYQGQDGFLQWNPLLTVNHEKYEVAKNFGSEGSAGPRSERASNVEAARQRALSQMEAAGYAYKFVTGPIIRQNRGKVAFKQRHWRSRNKFGIVTTEKTYEEALIAEEKEKAEAATSKDKAAAKTAAAWEKQRPAIRAVEAKLHGATTPTALKGLSIKDQRAFIYGRTGHHSKAKSNKNGEVELEATALFSEPLKLPPTPGAPADEGGAPADEGGAPADDGDGGDSEVEDLT